MLEVSFDVPLSIEESWSYVADGYFANHLRWDAGLQRLEQLDDGPIRPGMRGREVRSFAGERVSEFEISAVDPPRQLVLRDDPGLWTLERRYSFEPTDHGTSLTFTFDMRPQRAWLKLVFPIVSRLVIHRQVGANMERLRMLLTEHNSHSPLMTSEVDERGSSSS